MDRQSLLPTPTEILDNPGKVFILEAEPGTQRRESLQEWSEAISARGIVCRFVESDFALGGPWAGLRELFEDLVPQLEEQAPELLVKHDYELVTILPLLRHKLTPRNPNLTDLAPEDQQVRLYPADRAMRILHGLIDLLANWRQRYNPNPWVILCDNFDRAGYMVRRFFAELMRRKGESSRIVLLAACSPGERAQAGELFEPTCLAPELRLCLEPDAGQPMDPEKAATEAEEIEILAGMAPDDIELYLPTLIRLWSLSNQPARAIPWQLVALTTYGHRGFYQDAVGYGETALAHLEESFPDDDKMRLWLVTLLSACHWICGQPERALVLVQQVMGRLRSRFRIAKARYLLAMLHARYLPSKNFQEAEEQLDAALFDLAAAADISESERCFQVAFNRNGLAFIRFRQGRYEEALNLCRQAHQDLTENLAPGEHELHKSVLVYNQAQVYAHLGEMEEAIAHYTAVMVLDPNYAEYYNERGNAYLKLGRMELALADYKQSIELSPPFSEVRTNLGHCCRLMGKLEEAVTAYSDSLDLNPRQPGVLVVRAQCHEAMGMVDAALADYDAALELNPNQPLVLANRACLRHQKNQIREALADLNQAIMLSPGTGDLYRNRAVVLGDLADYEGAAADLEAYLRLDDSAPERDEVERELLSLRLRAAIPQGLEMAS
jgi:tetratricopeptide (TPR) repeat protein